MDVDHEIHEMAHRKEFFRRAMTTLWNNCMTGDYAEFGSYSAVTFRLAYEESRKLNYSPKLWAFDSFKGFPDSDNDHPRWLRGGMAMDLATFVWTLDYHNIPRDQYQIVPGLYKDTIGKDNQEASAYCPNIALAYVDCDLYHSSLTVFEFLRPRIKHGMIIALDDYHCWWADGVSGERLAMLETAAMLDEEFNFVPFVQFGWHGQSFFVESRRLLRGMAPRGHHHPGTELVAKSPTQPRAPDAQAGDPKLASSAGPNVIDPRPPEEYQALVRRVEALKGELESKQGELMALRQAEAAAWQSADDAELRYQAVKAHRDALLTSTSWRATAPVRRLVGALRRSLRL